MKSTSTGRSSRQVQPAHQIGDEDERAAQQPHHHQLPGPGEMGVDLGRQRRDPRRDLVGGDHRPDAVFPGHRSGSASSMSTSASGAVTMASCPVAISVTGQPSDPTRARTLSSGPRYTGSLHTMYSTGKPLPG